MFKRVRRESPASYLKVCALLVPREMKLEHSGGVKAMADVADAIEALVGPPERRSLPVAFDKNAIVQKLVEIAHTDENGIVHRLGPTGASVSSSPGAG